MKKQTILTAVAGVCGIAAYCAGLFIAVETNRTAELTLALSSLIGTPCIFLAVSNSDSKSSTCCSCSKKGGSK